MRTVGGFHGLDDDAAPIRIADTVQLHAQAEIHAGANRVEPRFLGSSGYGERYVQLGLKVRL